ncbi:hypothetical protein T12_2056 [Trichinella patagoniensis]|uniref:Uncharacterized protein n=1 Tax=Trichinella patagoniensis TaxID=990121 RepID=A0A0V1A4U7_9BILA|nr:hypothetical protein T12_2056 [Trichinella patagoniensis]
MVKVKKAHIQEVPIAHVKVKCVAKNCDGGKTLKMPEKKTTLLVNDGKNWRVEQLANATV